MPRLGQHSRNHSFPPCISFIQRKNSTHLTPPASDIDSEPWAHFLAPVPDVDDEDPSDYLDLSAGIAISTKKKVTKFRPSNADKWSHEPIDFHHGSYQRHQEDHGFVENRNDPWSHIVEQDVMAASHPSDTSTQLRPRGRSKNRTLSGHRHSWREPSADIFTVAEEVVDDSSVDEQEENGLTLQVPQSDKANFRPRTDSALDPLNPFESSAFPQRTVSSALSPLILDDDDVPEMFLSLGDLEYGQGSQDDSSERARL